MFYLIRFILKSELSRKCFTKHKNDIYFDNQIATESCNKFNLNNNMAKP